MIDYILIPLYGLISFAIGFFIAKKIYYKNGTDHYESYLKDIEEKGSWDPHTNGHYMESTRKVLNDPEFQKKINEIIQKSSKKTINNNT